MKKILALILTLTIVLTSFVFVGTTAYAADTDVSASDPITYGIGSVSGDFKDDPITYKDRDEVVCFGRYANKNTYLEFKEDSSKINPSNYLVYEVSVILSNNITQITLSNKTTSTSFSISKNIIEGSWNDFKLVLKYNNGTSGKLYINRKEVSDFTVADITKGLRISFDDPSKSTTAKEEVWVDTNSVKVTEKEPLDLFTFDSTTEAGYSDNSVDNNLIAYIASDDTPGEEKKVDGVYGRAVGDTSWYYKRIDGTPRLEVTFPLTFDNLHIDGYDIIVEASLYIPYDTTRLSVIGSGGTFINLYPSNYATGKWSKIIFVFNPDENGATYYVDGGSGTKKIDDENYINFSNYTEDFIRLGFYKVDGATISEGYINYVKVYQAPTGTVTGEEEKALTESTEGYVVDTEENTITTTNNVADLTADTLKDALNIADSAAVRAYKDADCTTPVSGKLADGDTIVVESEGGIFQYFTLKQEVLDVDANGKATFNPTGSVNATLIVAAYNADGTLAKIDTTTVNGAGTLTSSVPGAYNYKAFVFNNLIDAVPLVESVSLR